MDNQNQELSKVIGSKTVKDPNKLNLHFFSDVNGLQDTPYLQFIINVEVTQALMMFHTCHIYRNITRMIMNKELPDRALDSFMNLKNVLLSIEESLNNRIRTGSSSYIDDAYVEIQSDRNKFDDCLMYFRKIYNEYQTIWKEMQQQAKLKQQALQALENSEDGYI